MKEYFDRISSKELGALLGLFANDAVVYEPFSSEDGLHGIGEIEPFLKVVLMANSGLDREIAFPQKDDGNKIAVQVRFQRGGEVRGQFTFETEDVQTSQGPEKKIKKLKIHFS